MKAINKFFYALLALATVGMVGCQNAETYEPGAPELEGCYDVYFPDANTLETQGPIGDVDLDPSEKTEFTYTAYRNNVDDDITVPIVVSTNTEGKFVVSELKFEAGEDAAEFKVSLLESEIGVTYSLSFSIEDPLYVKQYESNNTNAISVNVTRVKWLDVGECSFTEDVLTSYWNFGFNPANPTYNVKVQVRADSINEAAFKAALDGTGSDAGLSGIYRIVNGWRVGVWADPEDTTLESDPSYVIINANPYNEAWIPLQELGLTVNGGMTSIYSLAAYYYDNDRTPTSDMFGKIEGGTLTFPTRALLMCPGGEETEPLFYSNLNGNFKLVIAPKLGKYSLVLPAGYEDGDFAFEAVKLPQGSLFYSESQAIAADVVIEKGKPVVNTDDADRNFVQQYGYLYRLVDPYAVDFPIYFGAQLDGTVTLHEDYAVQSTGLVQNGFEVYMLIDAEASKFDPETGLVNLVAEFGSLQGENFISYGVYNEIISVEEPDFNFGGVYDIKSDFTYAPLFTAPFTSKFMSDKYDATLEVGEGPGKGYFADKTPFRLPSIYAPGYDIYFVVGDEDGKVIIPAGFESQDTGVTVYGERVYMQIQNGTCSNKGVTLSAKFVNAEGEPVVAALCTESLVNYVWVDVATGSWTCNVLNSPLAGLKLQNAEDTNLYRVVDFMSKVTGVSGNHFMFTWDTTTNLCEVQGMIDTGIAASMLGVNAPGNIHFADEKTTWNWLDYPDTWESLEAEYGASVQPFFDPQSLTFVFRVSYFLPDADGYLTFNDGNGGKTAFVNELFTLDGAPQQSTWENVAVGTFTHTTDFYAPVEYLPYPEANLALQRFGQSNKYKIVGVANGQYDIEFTYDEATGAVEVPIKSTGLGANAPEGPIEASYMDWWGFVQTFNITDNAGNPLTKEDVYAVYPNGYDAATKTFSFYLTYADTQYGYVFTEVNDAYPTLHTFQITGDAPAASQSSAVEANNNNFNVKPAAKKFKMAVASKFKSMNGCRVTTLSKERKVEVKKSTSMKNATPVTRSYAKMEL